MAHAKNMAHRLGILEGADILVNVDADNFINQGFADHIQERFKTPGTFLWSRMIKDGPGKLPRGISGRIAVTREAFLSVGGYDERFKTWSPDDKDFNTRLRNLGYSAEEIEPKFLDGVSHNDKMRFKEYPHAETPLGEDQFHEVEFSTETIANYGSFGCGVVTRNFDPTPIHLASLPTRIFGVGLHKTGTTSLHEALRILGYDSAHWKSAHWAKAIWREMREQGRSVTLERSFALTDLPIPLLYRELDKAYPGSKFILTVRDEGKWLASVRNHWRYETNRFRAQWDSDPFTHRIHRDLYGQKHFDPDVFLERFRRHNAEVREYFGDRLHVLDVDKGPSWEGLCQFLGRPIPDAPYPKRHQTVEVPS
jgi:hypothetical protein